MSVRRLVVELEGFLGVGEFRQPGEPVLPVRSWRKALEDHAAEVFHGGGFVHAPPSHERHQIVTPLFLDDLPRNSTPAEAGGLLPAAGARLALISEGSRILCRIRAPRMPHLLQRNRRAISPMVVSGGKSRISSETGRSRLCSQYGRRQFAMRR